MPFILKIQIEKKKPEIKSLCKAKETITRVNRQAANENKKSLPTMYQSGVLAGIIFKTEKKNVYQSHKSSSQ